MIFTLWFAPIGLDSMVTIGLMPGEWTGTLFDNLHLSAIDGDHFFVLLNSLKSVNKKLIIKIE